MSIVVIKHTEVYWGDHSDPVQVSYIFDDYATLAEVMKVLSPDTRNKEWLEIPVQGGKVG
jgi:hypothetical protein